MAQIVETTSGKVEGTREGELSIFRGVPYAAPPVGALRWLAPAPPEPWSGVRQAAAAAAVAPQTRMRAGGMFGLSVEEEQDEDCLYLNVYTPASDGARRPVMLWIHGGAFTIGSGSSPIYDGSALASRGDVVVVTINYRLGVLGFLNLAEATSGAIPSTGNEGLLDQHAALLWVRDNIAAFGGDPGNVTIFGESAGGMSVGALLGMPRARGLFHKAIAQSGAAHTANSRERANKVAEKLLQKLGTSDPTALGARSPDELLHAVTQLSPGPGRMDPEIGGMPFQPVVDGEVLPARPIDTIAGGSAAGVAVMVGSTLEEWKLFGAMDRSIRGVDDAGLAARLGDGLSKSDAVALIDAYRKGRSERGEPVGAADLFFAIQTDRIFRAPGLRLAETQRAHDPRVYTYQFSWKSPMMGGLLGACHALELGFVFGTHKMMEQFCGSGPEADALAHAMQDAWVAFDRSGDPSTPALAWPAYDETRRATMFFDATSAVQDAPYEAERLALATLGEAALGTF